MRKLRLITKNGCYVFTRVEDMETGEMLPVISAQIDISPDNTQKYGGAITATLVVEIHEMVFEADFVTDKTTTTTYTYDSKQADDALPQ